MEILKTYRWREGVLSVKSIQDHMSAPRGQPLEPCPLGAPAESLWGYCPSDPALWEFLWKAFGDITQRTPLGGPVESLSRHFPENPALLGGSCGGLKYMF